MAHGNVTAGRLNASCPQNGQALIVVGTARFNQPCPLPPSDFEAKITRLPQCNRPLCPLVPVIPHVVCLRTSSRHAAGLPVPARLLLGQALVRAAERRFVVYPAMLGGLYVIGPRGRQQKLLGHVGEHDDLACLVGNGSLRSHRQENAQGHSAVLDGYLDGDVPGDFPGQHPNLRFARSSRPTRRVARSPGRGDVDRSLHHRVNPLRSLAHAEQPGASHTSRDP